MRDLTKRCFSVMCALLMTVMIFQNVSAEDNVVDVDVFMDSNQVQHKVWRNETNGTYQIHYANSLMENGTCLDFPGLIIQNTTYLVRYPQVAIDPISGFCYVLWLTYNNGSEELWYCGSNDLVNWTQMRYGCLKLPTKGNPTLDMTALNHTLYVTWKHGGNAAISPDLDADLIPDRYDDDPLEYDVTLGKPFEADVVAMNHILGVSVAIDYVGNSTEIPTITTTPVPGQAPGGASTFYVDISIQSNESFTAVVKISYNPSTLLPGLRARYLCLYFWDDVRWMVLANRTLDEDTGSDTAYNYVWGLTSHFSVYTYADALYNDCDSDFLNDGEEMNLERAEFTPINQMADSNTHANLQFTSTAQTHLVYFNIPDYLASLEYVVDAKFTLNGTSILKYFNVTIDIGNDGVTDWTYRDSTDFNSTTPSLVTPFNEYLSSHVDVDDGMTDYMIRTPVSFSSDEVGILGVSYISILVGTYDSDPTKYDSDGDKLNDGEEFNIAMAHPSILNTLEYQNVEQTAITMPISSQLIRENRAISNLACDSSEPVVVSGNILHSFWVEIRTYPPVPPYSNSECDEDIMHSSSSDHGASWTSPASVYHRHSFIPEIFPDSLSAAADGDYVGIVFDAGLSFQVPTLFIYSDDDGMTWQNVITVDWNFKRGFPSIDIQNGVAYIVYRHDLLVPEGDNSRFRGIEIKIYDDDTMYQSSQLFETFGPYGFPKVSVDGDLIHVVFCAPYSPDASINNNAFHMVSSLSRGIWSAPRPFVTYSLDGIPYTQNSFCFDTRDGLLCYAWQNFNSVDNSYDIYYVTGHEQTWSTPVRLTTADSYHLDPSLAIDSIKNVHITWQNEETGNVEYMVVDADTGNVMAQPDITFAEGILANPSIALDENDQPYIFWEQVANDNGVIYTTAPTNLLFLNVPIHDYSLEYIDQVSMEMNLIRTSATFDVGAEGFIKGSDGLNSYIMWDSTNRNLKFHYDASDNGEEESMKELDYTLTESSPPWKMFATCSFTNIQADCSGSPITLSQYTTSTSGKEDNKIEFVAEYITHGSGQCPKRLRATYWDMNGRARINLVTDCVINVEYQLQVSYQSERMTLSICGANGQIKATGFYNIGTNNNDGFLFSYARVHSIIVGGNSNGIIDGQIDNIRISFPSPVLKIDAGNDGDFWPVGEQGIQINEIKTELNQYLSLHKDADDGVADANCRIPICILGNDVGDLIISDIRVNVAILCTNPAVPDSDSDGLGDGEELNSARQRGTAISSFSSDGANCDELSFDFHEQMAHTAYVNVPATFGALEYVTDASMKLSWTPEVMRAFNVGGYSDVHLIQIPETGELYTYWLNSGIFYSCSYDGVSWGLPYAMTTGLPPSTVALAYALDSDRHIHAVFEYRPTGAPGHEISIGYTEWNENGWESLTTLDEGSEWMSKEPAIAIDSDDNVHVVWNDDGIMVNNLKIEGVMYRGLIDGVWTVPQLVGSDYDRDNAPAITTDSNNRIHIVWNVGSMIYMRILDGSTWSPLTSKLINYAVTTSPSLYVDWQNTLHITSGTTNGMIYGTCSEGVMGTFELIPTAVASTATICVDDKGTTHLVWRSVTNYSDAHLDGDIFYKCKTDNTWSATELISTYESSCLDTVAIIPVQDSEDSDSLLIFYTKQTSTTYDLVCKKFKGLNKIPGKITLDVGMDGDVQWAPGYNLLPIETTIDFSAEVAECLWATPPDENGIVSVPLGFYTGDYGTLRISNLRVVYDVIITNPASEYSDGDALSDGEEYFGQMLTRDLNADGDKSDACEQYLACSNPASIDSDLDGVFDDAEIKSSAAPSLVDTDYDLLSDWEEFNQGMDKSITDPANVDTDRDKYHDCTDAFPADPTEWLDTDFDNLGNNYDDSDDDNDGVSDGEDAFPLNPTGAVDTDLDGQPNKALTIPWWFSGPVLAEDLDDDGDSVPDADDDFPLDRTEWVDTDLDGIGNNDDLDDDNDGVNDFGPDGFPGNRYQDDDMNGKIDDGTDWDRDGDNDTSLEMGMGDDDLDALDPSRTIDTDGDGIDNTIDADDDNDGRPDAQDAFPLNPMGRDDMDHDGFPDWVYTAPVWFNGVPLTPDVDVDGDGVVNRTDRFPLNPTEWMDTDVDGIGDNTDDDDDGDGVPDTSDAFPTNPTGTVDTDKDKRPDFALGAPPWWTGTILIADPDDDNDGLADNVETNTKVYVSPSDTGTNPLVVDTDRDKVSDYDEVMGRTIYIEIDNLPGADIIYTVNSDPTKKNSDNDLLDDFWEKQYGTDPRHEDTDNDGLMDQDELIDEFGGGWMLPGDTDTDSVPNGPTDWDSNGNAVPDGLENVVSGFPIPGQTGYDGGADYDGDGLSNQFELTTDYNPSLPGIQNTSYLTKDSDKDGFLDGADLDSGSPRLWKVLTKSSTGIFTKLDYLVKIGLDMGIQRGEGYLAPPSAVGTGQKWTKALDGDSDKDGIPDGTDADPTVDIKVTVKLFEILELDKVDPDGLLSGHNPADFYVWVKCDRAKAYLNFFGVEIEMPYYRNDLPRKSISRPIIANDDHLTPDELHDEEFTFNVPDYKDELRTFTIYLFDDDGGDKSSIQESLDGKDDICDISWNPGGGDEDNPTTSFLKLDYNLETAQWSDGDSLGDANGYGHASGNQDGSSDAGEDEDDCELWFDITQNDADADGLPYWLEVNADDYGIGHYHDPITKNMDYDEDKIPDWWEWKYGLDLDNGYDWDNDPDHDGLNYLEEFWCGSPIPDTVNEQNYISRQDYTFGGHPHVKDIFVEVDWMMKPDVGEPPDSFWPGYNHSMSKEAQYKVIKAFAQHNIHLWIDDGWMGGGAEIPPSDRITFDDFDSNHPDYPDYMDYYTANQFFNENRRQIFHYCIFAHDIWYNDAGSWVDSIDGLAYPDDDRFMIAGDNMWPLVEDQAQTFMHELGHNIGLGSGDYDGIDSKSISYSNYPSVMNYNWDWWNSIDYSDGTGFNDWEHILDGDLTC